MTQLVDQTALCITSRMVGVEGAGWRIGVGQRAALVDAMGMPALSWTRMVKNQAG